MLTNQWSTHDLRKPAVIESRDNLARVWVAYLVNGLQVAYGSDPHGYPRVIPRPSPEHARAEHLPGP